MEGIKMSITFNASEILEMAIQIEKNGQKFYRKAAQIVSDKKAGKLLLDLADMEVKHELIFKEMKEHLTEKEKELMVYDPDDEASMYLQAFADGYIFNMRKDISAQLTGKESPSDIFNTAIGIEKDSIVFYVGLKDFLPTEAGKEKVENVIREEKNHIAILNGMIKQYKQ